jgi:hypothetical protein
MGPLRKNRLTAISRSCGISLFFIGSKMIKKLAVLSLVVSTAACGGGGGGGSAPSSATVVLSPLLPAASSTKSYPAASAALSFNAGATPSGITSAIEAIGAGSQITITTDATGALSNFSITTNTNGANFSLGTNLSQSLPNSATAIDAVTLLLQAGFANPGSFVAVAAQTQSAVALWGRNNNNTSGNFGGVSVGIETTAASRPVAGTATFNGVLAGGMVSSLGYFSIAGDVAATANFGTNTITTSFSNILQRNVSTNGTSTLGNFSGTGAINGSRFTTTVSGAGFNGTTQGAFYGASANEIAGVIRATSPANSATLVGVFAGAR